MRGLKSTDDEGHYQAYMSHPVRGAWIEISMGVNIDNLTSGSHPVRGAWIEIESVE